MIPASVVVASRGRPELLLRCLRSLEQQFHPQFEVIVVADAEGGEAAAAAFPGRLKLIRFDEANVAAARNLGIAAAAAPVVAFIDDDAAAEPTWLDRLTAALELPGVVAAGGYVRGRNGYSFQSRAREIDRTGASFDIEVPEGDVLIPTATPGRAVRCEGTNMAFNRQAIVDIGGFDPAFAFFHDESDLFLRLAYQGGKVAVVPPAQVHHAFASSERRRFDRLPLDLGDVGESSAVFLRKHAADRIAARRQALFAEQRRRLLAHMVAGRCQPGEVSRLLAGFDAGFERGLTRQLPGHEVSGDPPPFLRFALPPTATAMVAGRPWHRRRLDQQARRLRASGQVVTVVRLSRTALYHSSRFRDDGIWEHRGGIWGRAARNQPLLQRSTFAQRVAQIRGDIALMRQIAEAADATECS